VKDMRGSAIDFRLQGVTHSVSHSGKPFSDWRVVPQTHLGEVQRLTQKVVGPLKGQSSAGPSGEDRLGLLIAPHAANNSPDTCCCTPDSEEVSSLEFCDAKEFERRQTRHQLQVVVGSEQR
jgi:hypothetical protein